jgi:hypothetical protein
MQSRLKDVDKEIMKNLSTSIIDLQSPKHGSKLAAIMYLRIEMQWLQERKVDLQSSNDIWLTQSKPYIDAKQIILPKKKTCPRLGFIQK